MQVVVGRQMVRHRFLQSVLMGSIPIPEFFYGQAAVVTVSFD
ncbi:hypothetical protein [Domibacillus enclensis]|nr:hypothetical protein [Domibacillus enclensis]